MWAQDWFRFWGHNINQDLVWSFIVWGGEGSWGREETRGVNKRGGSAWTTWNILLGRGSTVRGTGKAWPDFPGEIVCKPRPKSTSYWQRLGLELSGIMEPNVQSQEIEKSQSREMGMMDSEQGKIRCWQVQACFKSSDFLP